MKENRLSLAPRPVVSAYIIIKGEVLLIKRAGPVYENYWAMPGGIIDLFEGPEEAVRREVFEETGLHFIIQTIVNAHLIKYFSKGLKNIYSHTSVDIVYKGIVNEKNIVFSKERNKEILDVRTFKKDNLPKKIAFGHRTIINNFR